ncbi:MAG: site-specific integrase, partial [Rhodospirillaceae bacterium]|nr:site-specific integrase [Rhodospirillaceae bacterium]
RRLREGEEWKLINKARTSSRKWLRAAIAISLETCMRQSELAGLVWRRVKLYSDHPHVDLPKTKNERPRRVPLSRRAIAAFHSIRPKNTAPADFTDQPVLSVETARGVIHAFREVITEKDFPDLRWHDLRHEAISRLFELTDLRDHEIMTISGHLTPAMLARYTHLRADRLGSRLRGGKQNRAA